jgi:predicted helicase
VHCSIPFTSPTATGKPRTKKTTSTAKSKPSSTRDILATTSSSRAPECAVLYQAGARVADEDISKPDYLAQLVNRFFDYTAPNIEEWRQAVAEFSERVPELANAVFKIVEDERRKNPAFVRSFEDFYALCRQAINPNLSTEAVERMLIQHLLTERIFRKIFNNPDFIRRNVVAQEIEKVIAALTSRSFNRDAFLAKLDSLYDSIERNAKNAVNFTQKQDFLNTVYERFFQGYSPKEADTHGIVYTPQPIVNFMVRSVEEILQKEFGRSLGDKGVHILDPFVGTGNFIVRIIAANLRGELPRIPFASVSSVPSVVKDFEVFNSLATVGQRLAEIHVHYEQQPEYKLTKTEKKGEKLDYRVTKMKLSKDKTTLIYNQFLTLSGVPKETFDYRLGNRSALEWVIDQYQVSTDKRSGIINDPNREDDPQYILRLIGQVITVSLETVKIVASFPKLQIPEGSNA